MRQTTDPHEDRLLHQTTRPWTPQDVLHGPYPAWDTATPNPLPPVTESPTYPVRPGYSRVAVMERQIERVSRARSRGYQLGMAHGVTIGFVAMWLAIALGLLIRQVA